MNENKEPPSSQTHSEDSAYEPFNPRKAPHQIYLYWIPREHHSDRPAREYFLDLGQPLPMRDLFNAVEDMLSAIEGRKLRPTGRDFLNLSWDRQTYLVFVFEGKLTPGGAVTFSSVVHKDNRSFKDGKDLPAFSPPFDYLSGFYCINYVRPRPGSPIPAEPYSERFEFSIGHGFMHDGAGTNQGPPVSPPSSNEDPND